MFRRIYEPSPEFNGLALGPQQRGVLLTGDSKMLESSRSAKHPLNSEGLWYQVFQRPARGRPALFLDRDGTVIEETGYLHRVEDIIVIPGGAEVIATANEQRVPVIIVTNQSGIGRGYYGWTEFKFVQDAIVALLAAEGARINAVYACACHPEAEGLLAHPNHPARKPNPGMLLQAAADLALDLKSSWLVGDKADDIEAAKRAGIAGALQVATGHGDGERHLVAKLATANFEVRFGQSIADAMTLPILVPADGG
jgi:D-glycero-D-manno-heptose 1,7-bisphosphate phosphatase